MLDNIPKEKKNGGDEIVVQQKNTENSIDGANAQGRNLKENGKNKKTYIQN